MYINKIKKLNEQLTRLVEEENLTKSLADMIHVLQPIMSNGEALKTEIKPLLSSGSSIYDNYAYLYVSGSPELELIREPHKPDDTVDKIYFIAHTLQGSHWFVGNYTALFDEFAKRNQYLKNDSLPNDKLPRYSIDFDEYDTKSIQILNDVVNEFIQFVNEHQYGTEITRFKDKLYYLYKSLLPGINQLLNKQDIDLQENPKSEEAAVKAFYKTQIKEMLDELQEATSTLNDLFKEIYGE